MRHRKGAEAIKAQTKDYQDEQAPSMGYVRSNEDRKLCLQKQFELGQDCPALYKGGAKVKPTLTKQPTPKKPQPKSDQMSELVAGMEERRQFLEEMEAAGMGEKYGAQIRGEIAGCLREIQELEARESAWAADDADL